VQTTVDTEQPGREEADTVERTAYRLGCGHWLLAFDVQWATGISEVFSLHPIPRAPAWLSGCTNADGLLVPVVDLLQLMDPQASAVAVSGGGKVRLLLGTHSAGDNEEALGLLFNGLPQQIHRPHPHLGIPKGCSHHLRIGSFRKDDPFWMLDQLFR
jgi:hypothetical protein